MAQQKAPLSRGFVVLVRVQLSNYVERCWFFHFVFPGVLDVQGFKIVIGERQLEGCRVLDFVQVVVQFVGV